MRFCKPTIYIFFFLLFFSMAESVDAAGGSGTCTSPPSVYYSVGQDAADHKTGSPTVTISSGTATFSVAQTATNMGVGDRVTYGQIDITSFADQGGGLVRITTSTAHAFLNDDYISISGTTNYNGTYKIANATANSYFDITHGYTAETGGSTKYAANIAYISGKTSTTAWTLIDKLGCSYISNRASAVVVNSIAHEYTSLAAAEAGASDSNHLNTTNLVTPGGILNIPLYYDSGPDTTAVTIDGWTTGVGNFIKIYTPNNTSTEVNQSQRHSGKWDDGKYRLDTNTIAINNIVNYLNVVGLQIKVSRATGGGILGISKSGTAGSTVTNVSNNIIVGNLSGGASGIGIQVAASLDVLNASNNIIYNFSSSGSKCIYNSFRTAYIYNNTFVACDTGIYNDGITVAKNNIFKSNTAAALGTFSVGTDYNLTDNSSMGYTVTGGGNTHDKLSQSISFTDAANGDFHLSPSDTAAKGAGTNLYADANLAVTTDIDGQARPNASSTIPWDIGADEYVVTTNTRYVDPNSTAGGDGTTNALTGANRAYASLSEWEAARQANLVTGNIIEKVICSSDDAGSTHLADTTPVTLSGWTTNATHYIQIESASSHGGKWNDNIYRRTRSITFIADHVNVVGIQIHVASGPGIDLNSSNRGILTVSGCIIISDAPTTYNGVVRVNSNMGYTYTARIYNNIIVGSGVSTFGIYFSSSAVTSYVYNNTIWHNNSYALYGDAGTAIAVNNILYRATIGNACSGTLVNGTDYNASNRALGYTVTGGGNTHDRAARTFTFVDAANKDFHLAPTDRSARDAGIDLSADAYLPFSTDIDGENRPLGQGWDIGADEASYVPEYRMDGAVQLKGHFNFQ